MIHPTKEEIVEFLSESNAIEGVYSDEALEDSLSAWEYLMSQDVLTENVVHRTHKILMRRQPLEEAEKGSYRLIRIFVGDHEGAKAGMVPVLMMEWIKVMNYPDQGLTTHGLESFAQRMHVEYEKIHPYVDGNGRTGRMFMNWNRLTKLELPLKIIHEGSEQRAYYQWFK